MGEVFRLQFQHDIRSRRRT